MPQDIAPETEEQFRDRMRREIGEIMRERSKVGRPDEPDPPWTTEEEGDQNAGPV